MVSNCGPWTSIISINLLEMQNLAPHSWMRKFAGRPSNLFFFFFLIFIYIYLFMAVLGPRFCARAFSSCGKQGPLFIAMRRPLTIAASLVEEHRLQTRRLSNCGSRA